MDYISSQSTGNGQLSHHGDLQDRHRLTSLRRSCSRRIACRTRCPGCHKRCNSRACRSRRRSRRCFSACISIRRTDPAAPNICPTTCSRSATRSRALPGVADFQIFGERQYAMRIWIDPDKAAASDISASDILTALRAQNAQVSAGVLNQPPVVNNWRGLSDQRRGARPPHHARAVRRHHRQVGQPGAHHPHSRHRPRRTRLGGLRLDRLRRQVSRPLLFG